MGAHRGGGESQGLGIGGDEHDVVVTGRLHRANNLIAIREGDEFPCTTGGRPLHRRAFHRAQPRADENDSRRIADLDQADHALVAVEVHEGTQRCTASE